jgi:hypothetical protein
LSQEQAAALVCRIRNERRHGRGQLAPAAATRLINTIPGRNEDLDNPDPMRHPKLVTPAVLLMCSEDAPTGKVFQAGNGRFSVAAIFSNPGLVFGADVTYEDLLANKDELLDMSAAEEGNTSWRRIRESN